MKKLLLGASIIALTAVTSMTFADEQTDNQMQSPQAATTTPDTQAMPANTDNSAATATTPTDADQAASDKKKQDMMMDQTQQPANGSDTSNATQPAQPSSDSSSNY